MSSIPKHERNLLDTSEDIVSGDLGLGLGLKPGGLRPDVTGCDVINSVESGVSGFKRRSKRNSSCSSSTSYPTCPTSCHYCQYTEVPPPCCAYNQVTSDEDITADALAQLLGIESSYPKSGGCVPCPDALTQETSNYQQESFHPRSILQLIQNSQRFRRSSNTKVDPEPQCNQEKKRFLKHSKQEDIEKKLILTIQEVEELKTEFETCQQRLESKYEAIRILKKQIEVSRRENSSNERKVKSENEQLIKAVNSLQFALEQQESTLMDSQETWARRFDRVCTENVRLLSAYEERSEELRRAVSQKMAVTRERDELLALLDVQEKMKYVKTHNNAEDENDKYSSFSSTELAILGACMCRGHRTEPCGCAYSAANLHRELLKIKEDMDLNRQLRQEAYLTMDAYRYAFEEQLLSSKQLMKCINDLNTRRDKKGSSSFKLNKESESVLHAVLGLSTDQDGKSTPPESQTPQNLTTAKLKQLDLESLDSPHFVTLLLEMLQEKSELLAFQKLAARILANKVKELQFLQCEHLTQPTYNVKCMKENSKLFTDQSMAKSTTTTATHTSTTTSTTSINSPMSMNTPTYITTSSWQTY